MADTELRDGALAGQPGSSTLRDTTFHGNDPETVAADSICQDTPTRCQARTRLYRDGQLVDQGFPIERISDHLEEMRALITDNKHDLLAPLPGGSGQTLLREALLIADHNAYHVAQLIDVRRLLGTWKG